MNFLPSEVLSEIFLHLNGDELLKLTSCCRSFNDTISSNFNISRKLQMTFRKLNCGEENSLGNRRYEKLRIKFVKVSLHLPMIEKIGDGITDLNFTNCRFKLDVIRRILLATTKVKFLSFDSTRLSDVPNKIKSPIPQYEMKSLRCSESDPRLFKVVISCQVENLSVNGGEFSDFSDFDSLLKLQRYLNELQLDNFTKTSLFTDNTLSHRLSFNLKSFTVTSSVFFKTIYLKTFAENQAKLLEKLRIHDVELCDFSSVVNQTKKLKVLEISNVSLNFLDVVQTIEELLITGNKFSTELCGKFPHVKKLKLTHVKNKEVLNKLSMNLKEIECLEIVEGSIEGLEMPTLRKLTLKSVIQIPVRFFGVHSEVEILQLENCTNCNDEIVEEIARNLKSLKSMTIFGSEKISDESLKTLKQFSTKLEVIKIKGTKEKLNWNIFEKQRNIKIYIEV